MKGSESRVFYLMGASGAGKDLLMRLCRARLREADRCFVAHRYITREPELAGENHIWLHEAEFDKRLRLGAFAMHWCAHGQRYALGEEVNHWLAQGISVLVNGSRAYLPQARELYHHRLIPVLVRVDARTLQQRLQARGRESATQIEARVARAQALEHSLEGTIHRLDNSGDPEQAVQALLALIRGFGLAENPLVDALPADG